MPTIPLPLIYPGPPTMPVNSSQKGLTDNPAALRDQAGGCYFKANVAALAQGPPADS